MAHRRGIFTLQRRAAVGSVYGADNAFARGDATLRPARCAAHCPSHLRCVVLRLEPTPAERSEKRQPALPELPALPASVA